MERKTVFISHTAHERDNYFALWLDAKLKLAGYDSWCEIERFKGGEECWLEIQNVLKLKTIAFIPIVSHEYCSKLGEGKSGVRKELNYADKCENIPKGNIIPILIDDLKNQELPIDLNPYWYINASSNWEIGLRSILDKFEKEKVLKVETPNDILNSWYTNTYSLKYGLRTKQEIYYTNWWKIEKLPEFLFIYHYYNEQQASAILDECDVFPTIRHGNTIVTFDDSIPTICLKKENLEILPKLKQEIKINQVIDKSYYNEEFPTLSDTEYLIKRLLNKSIHNFLINSGLSYYEMANGKLCYYYPTGKVENNKVTFSYPNKLKKTKNLLGKYYDSMWHFGISSKANLLPTLHYSLKMHILFSDDGKEIWKEKNEIQSARRQKGRTWFNEEWRDQLMAFLCGLKDETGAIKIPLNNSQYIQMPESTIYFTVEYGYCEPESNARQSILNTWEEEESYYQEDII